MRAWKRPAPDAAPVSAHAETVVLGEFVRPTRRHWAGIAFQLALRTFRLRYLRSRLGVGWMFVQPLVQTAVLAFIFTRVFSAGGVEHYPLYVLSGIVTWQAFSTAVAAGTTAVVDNSALLRKVPMPASLFPISQVVSVAMVLAAQYVVLAVMAGGLRTAGWELLLLPLVVGMLVFTALGVSLLTSALHVGLRDVKFVVEALLLVAFYASPILYSATMVPDRLLPWLQLNPMYGVLVTARTALLGEPFSWYALSVGAAVACGLAIVGSLTFRRMSPAFPDLA